MASAAMSPLSPILETLPPGQKHEFSAPSKRIHNGADMDFFLSSTAYRDIIMWLLQLNRSMFPTAESQVSSLDLERLPRHMSGIQAILHALEDLIRQAPPSTGPRRFGNVAFREWYRLAEQAAVSDLLQSHLSSVSRQHDYDSDGKEASGLAVEELRSYLLGSLGSSQRLDYGTGHELSYLAFLGCLWKLGAFDNGDERAIVLGLIQPYLRLVRKLIMTYNLEPAGSHGVWGLDDHSFLPYIFGSAQFGPPIDQFISAPIPTEGSSDMAPSPSSITQKAEVADYKDRNMYFSAIQFIYDVKRGPFWEHSPVLYDVSGIKDGWAKINKGMLKMYVAEVLGKFPVVQHFPFGSLFRWEQEKPAVHQASTVHAQQQPGSLRSQDVPAPAPAPAPSPAAMGTAPASAKLANPRMGEH